MKTLILCGGEGLRMKGNFPETPKPLVCVQGKPLLSYILDHFMLYGMSDFILLTGILEPTFQTFARAYAASKKVSVTVLPTGDKTPTGGRISMARSLLIEEEHFFVTYGDGIADIDLDRLLNHHLKEHKLATLTAVRPTLPFGLLNITNDGTVESFVEKPQMDAYINGGFFVFRHDVLEMLNESDCLETEILPKLSACSQLGAYLHDGFWRNMDTYKDYLLLETMDLSRTLYAH